MVDVSKNSNKVLMSLIGGVLSLCVAMFYALMLKSQPLPVKEKPVTVKLARQIEAGAKAFLYSEYKALAGFVVVIAICLGIIVSWQNMICFIVGAFLSATSGYFGMIIATISNVRTTLACQGDNGLNEGLKVAFRSGSVMALSVVGSGLTGLSIMFLIFDDWEHLSGFAFGGSSIALFARVGGGIYTKAADVGADLVGKVEEELEEDSPDNPATIADNVGDNVGDVAGMGADLFESFVGSIVAAGTIGKTEFPGGEGAAFPFYVAGFGALCSIIGTLLVRTKSMNELQLQADHTEVVPPSVDPKSPMSTKSGDDVHAKTAVLEGLLFSIRRAIFLTSAMVVGTTAISVVMVFGDKTEGWNLFACVIVGLLCGNLIGYFTEYATSYTYYPTQSIARKSDTGPATVIIQGLGVGMLSTLPPVIFIVITMLAAYYIADPHGVYGIAITAVGMLSTLGVTLATDAFGPVADNAGGIAEMAPESEIDDQVRETTDQLDALGNTTAATGKGFAIGSAVLTALALMQAFSDAAGLKVFQTSNRAYSTSADGNGSNLLDPVVLPGVLLGALMPFVFAALTMLSVGKAAEAIMWECRDQMNKKYFDNAPLEPAKCVKISTIASLQEMVTPGVAAVFMPVVVGTLLGASGLMGLLTGSIASGFLLGVMMSNAGGAWDNSKKYVEKGYMGKDKGKKSDNHKATVVGDTVGDPFKDTSGPALNILIKLMSIVSLVLAPQLTNAPWEKDKWPIGLGVLVALTLAGYWYHEYYLSQNSLHDIKAILAQSKKRKAGVPGFKKEEEEEKQQDKEEEKAADETTGLTPLDIES